MWRVLTGVCVAFVVLFGAWGTWLVASEDPDGGARLAGWFMVAFMVALAAANVIVLSATLVLRRSSTRS